MRGLAAVDPAALRVRRWDAVVLGGALPGLAAAVRLGMQGVRVLVLEEESGARAFDGLREPFLTTSADAGTVLGTCLQALGVALIDRRRIGGEPLAYQVVLPTARIDVGEAALTARELVAWGLAKPDEARALVRALAEAAAAESAALLEHPIVEGRRRARARHPLPIGPSRPAAPPRPRGLPAEVTEAAAPLASCLEAQWRALSNAAGPVPPEAVARLLGLALEGAAPGSARLRPVLRRRVETLFGEFRTLAPGFRLVNAARQPGVAPGDANEAWVGRALVLNAPRAALAAALDSVPDLLRERPAERRRVALHFRAPADVLPEGMAARVIRVGDPARPLEGTNLVTVRCFPGARPGDPVDVVAAAAVPVDAAHDAAAEIEAALARLVPFGEGRLRRVTSRSPRWDDDAPLGEPPRGAAWPGESTLRLSARPSIYALDRSGVGALGAEGDLLLGWRAGDAIAADLA